MIEDVRIRKQLSDPASQPLYFLGAVEHGSGVLRHPRNRVAGSLDRTAVCGCAHLRSSRTGIVARSVGRAAVDHRLSIMSRSCRIIDLPQVAIVCVRGIAASKVNLK